MARLCPIAIKGRNQSRIVVRYSFFRLITTELEYDAAQASCQADGAHLAYLKNQDEVDSAIHYESELISPSVPHKFFSGYFLL